VSVVLRSAAQLWQAQLIARAAGEKRTLLRAEGASIRSAPSRARGPDLWFFLKGLFIDRFTGYEWTI